MMAVYFVSPIGQSDLVKIGHTDNLDERLGAIAASFEHGIELLAQCDGGIDVERAFHSLFADSWSEGEWYRRSDSLSAAIAAFSSRVSGRRVWSRLRAVQEQPRNAVDVDRDIAKRCLTTLMDSFGNLPIMQAQEHAFSDLQAINPIWSRRRVRALWEGSVRRVDHFEVRDLEQVLAAHREATAGLGGMDRPGTEGVS